MKTYGDCSLALSRRVLLAVSCPVQSSRPSPRATTDRGPREPVTIVQPSRGRRAEGAPRSAAGSEAWKKARAQSCAIPIVVQDWADSPVSPLAVGRSSPGNLSDEHHFLSFCPKHVPHPRSLQRCRHSCSLPNRLERATLTRSVTRSLTPSSMRVCERTQCPRWPVRRLPRLVCETQNPLYSSRSDPGL